MNPRSVINPLFHSIKSAKAKLTGVVAIRNTDGHVHNDRLDLKSALEKSC